MMRKLTVVTSMAAQTERLFAAVGVTSLVCLGICIIRLFLALANESDVTSTFLPVPPRDAFSERVLQY